MFKGSKGFFKEVTGDVTFFFFRNANEKRGDLNTCVSSIPSQQKIHERPIP